MKQDTICAISTPLGISGIGIVRLSGPAAGRIIGKIFRPRRSGKIKDWPTHTVRYGHIADGKRHVDEVLVTVMRAPASYTREDMAEIGCHGGLTALKEVLALCLKNGARLAEAGEFTRRAFLNGRIDLAQAESVLAVIESRTEKSLEIALNSLRGNLSAALEQVREKTFHLLARIEALIDFPEEDVDAAGLDPESSIRKLAVKIGEILRGAQKGKVFVNGVKAAIVGGANVGKSSLLNALLREERAIVSEIPGTTRDFLHETINIKGIPVRIIDTAGIRKARGKIESMGVRKALEWMNKAEIILLVLDAGKPLRKTDRTLLSHLAGRKCVVILNKNDLPVKIDAAALKKTIPPGNVVSISAKLGAGIEALEEKIYTAAGQGLESGEEDFLLNLRQEDLLRRVAVSLARALEAVRKKMSVEFIAQDLREAVAAIDGITGKNISEDILDTIFSRFCIGK